MTEGLDAWMRGMRRGAPAPAVCRDCGTPYDVSSAKLFVVYGERIFVENDKIREGRLDCPFCPDKAVDAGLCLGYALAE